MKSNFHFNLSSVASHSGIVLSICLVWTEVGLNSRAARALDDPQTQEIVTQGLDWLVYQQHKLGHWTAQGRYPTAMTALAGLAFLCEGSTTTQGKYAENLRRAVDFLTRRSRPNGLIVDMDDERYT